MCHRREEHYAGTLRLRHQLAKEGCSESQVSIAKFLLNECGDSHSQRKCNAKVAVEWLRLAAEEGNVEARYLLKQCYETGLGITGQNSSAVQKCLLLSDTEITSIHIGNRIFRAMSDSEETVSEETFQRKVEFFLKQDKNNLCEDTSEFGCAEEKLCVNRNTGIASSVSCEQAVSSSISTETGDQQNTKSDSNDTNSEGISVIDIVTSVRQCLEGSVPVITLKRVSIQFEQCYSGYFLRYICTFWNHVCRGTEALVKGIGNEFPPCILFLFLLFLYNFGFLFEEEAESVTQNLKVQVSFARMVIMTIMLSCSCFIIYQKIGYYNVEKWLTLIKIFKKSVPSENVKQKYLENTTFPFYTFFLSSFLLTALRSNDVVWFPAQEIFVFSLFMMFILDRTICDNRYYVNFSLLLNILLCLYKQNFISMSYWNWFNFAMFDVRFVIFKHYNMHINVPTMVAIVLPYLYVKMLSVKNGLKLVLLPHLMCIVWLNFTCSIFKESDMGDVFYCCAFWLLVLITANYINPIISLFVGILAKTFVVTGLTCGKLLCLILIFTFIYYFCISMIGKLKSLLLKHKIFLSIFTGIMLSIFISGLFEYSVKQTSNPKEVWKHYEQLCHHQSWYYSNTAEVQIACLPFNGASVSFEGKVVGIDVGIENILNYVTSFLPSHLSKWFVCAVGEQVCTPSQNIVSVQEKERCDILKHLKIDHCHLSKWNKYHYDLHVEISSRLSPEVIVKVDHACSSFVTDLMDGDSIQVIGILDDSLGKALPKVIMQEANFTGYKRSSHCKIQTQTVKYEDHFSLKQLVEFYFFPLIQYHLSE